MVKHNEGEYMMVRVTILMVLKGSRDILKEDSLPKVVSERRNCHCIWLNMFGNIIIEMIIDLQKKLILQQLGRCHV